ncbi:MAG: HAMP domain-containing histidine kinase [Bacteroidetes bacterium]|jgi:two-component system phosphate regulon sensor histidine kinase PhoR|nr:HAMP domain-containing histidine kinase [Bacteroidota bacterium]
MNKKVIFGIIGLMAIAIAGVMWSQIRLIQSATLVQTERFEKNVFSALNEVVKKLELDEEKDLFLASMSEKYPNSNVPTFNPFGSKEKDKNLENRIKIDYLDLILKEELAIRGINIQIPSYRYHYGVYGFEKSSFIILDGKKYDYEQGKENILPEYVNSEEENTAFKVNIFPRERPVPGELRIFFPNKNAIILRSLGKTLLATLFFAGIILVCFAYTLYIIFTQKKLSEMKTDFINNMTHEFKTPIATISLASDSLNNPAVLKSEEKILRFSRIIKQENIRMHKQVEKVLQMALLDKKDFNLKWSSVHLHELIQAAIENISLQVETREGTVKGFLNASEPVVKGDQTHLSNIIHNLLDNANKYSPQKPHITVFTRNVDKGVEIIVKDEGIGMSRDARKFIFDKFYRVPTGNIHNVKGFGLGLTYVKTMVEAHKGKIDVRSEPGKGSSFILFFPFN